MVNSSAKFKGWLKKAGNCVIALQRSGALCIVGAGLEALPAGCMRHGYAACRQEQSSEIGTNHQLS